MEEKENKYLKEFEELKKDAINTNRRKAYWAGRKYQRDPRNLSDGDICMENLHNLMQYDYNSLKPNEKLKLRGDADRWLRSDNMQDLVKAALFFYKTGKLTNFTKKMVLKGVKKQKDLTERDNAYLLEDLREIFKADFDNSNSSNLEHKVAAAIALAGVVSGLIFLSPNLTGNVIGNLSNSSSNIIGGVLFLIGLVGAFFSIRGR